MLRRICFFTQQLRCKTHRNKSVEQTYIRFIKALNLNRANRQNTVTETLLVYY